MFMPPIPPVPVIFPESITSPVFGCWDATCAFVYIFSTGPIVSAKTYDFVFSTWPEEQPLSR